MRRSTENGHSGEQGMQRICTVLMCDTNHDGHFHSTPGRYELATAPASLPVGQHSAPTLPGHTTTTASKDCRVDTETPALTDETGSGQPRDWRPARQAWPDTASPAHHHLRPPRNSSAHPPRHSQSCRRPVFYNPFSPSRFLQPFFPIPFSTTLFPLPLPFLKKKKSHSVITWLLFALHPSHSSHQWSTTLTCR